MKDKVMTILFISIVFGFSIASIIIPDEEISKTERRKLNTFPEAELSNKYISKVDKYFLDHFVLRDEFRSLKAAYKYRVLNNFDNNGIYLKDKYIFKSNYPTNLKSIDNFNTTIGKLKGLFGSDNNIYMMIVPDKNYYLEDANFLQLDYEKIYNSIDYSGMQVIDIRDRLQLEDFYYTDTHWRQERLSNVVDEMDEKMKFIDREVSFEKHSYDKFYGVYYGESALKREGEMLTYLTSKDIDEVEVSYLENAKLKSVYNVEKLEELDAYEVYLDGASAFIEISNANNNSGKELVVFRDSFGSSLVPLLIPYYSHITVIDNRYITSNNFKDLVPKAQQDVLFLYSTLIVNNSYSLKG